MTTRLSRAVRVQPNSWSATFQRCQQPQGTAVVDAPEDYPRAPRRTADSQVRAVHLTTPTPSPARTLATSARGPEAAEAHGRGLSAGGGPLAGLVLTQTRVAVVSTSAGRSSRLCRPWTSRRCSQEGPLPLAQRHRQIPPYRATLKATHRGGADSGPSGDATDGLSIRRPSEQHTRGLDSEPSSDITGGSSSGGARGGTSRSGSTRCSQPGGGSPATVSEIVGVRWQPGSRARRL